MNNEYYELYYRNEAGELVYCGDFDDETQLKYACDWLGWEFPKNEYFYETVKRVDDETQE